MVSVLALKKKRERGKYDWMSWRKEGSTDQQSCINAEGAESYEAGVMYHDAGV